MRLENNWIPVEHQKSQYPQYWFLKIPVMVQHFWDYYKNTKLIVPKTCLANAENKEFLKTPIRNQVNTTTKRKKAQMYATKRNRGDANDCVRPKTRSPRCLEARFHKIDARISEAEVIAENPHASSLIPVPCKTPVLATQMQQPLLLSRHQVIHLHRKVLAETTTLEQP